MRVQGGWRKKEQEECIIATCTRDATSHDTWSCIDSGIEQSRHFWRFDRSTGSRAQFAHTRANRAHGISYFKK